MKFASKCEICGSKIQKTFLDKILGTPIKDAKGKFHTVCFECQRKLKSKDEILSNIK